MTCWKKYGDSKSHQPPVLWIISSLSLGTAQPPSSDNLDKNPSAALKGERELVRGSESVLTDVYDWDKLRIGNTVSGPAVVEGTDTTYLVPRGWEMVLDSYGNGKLTRR